MNKSKKVFIALAIPAALILGIFAGRAAESMKYHVALAGCIKSELPGEKYAVINLQNSPAKKMFQNYYSPNLDFAEYYVPENADAKDYLETFGYGGFHYFKTSAGDIYRCGFSK